MSLTLSEPVTSLPAQAVDATRRYFDPIEIAPREQIEALQEKRLLEQVAYVAEHSKLVREIWGDAGVKVADIKSVADYKRLVPMFDKDALRAYRDTKKDPFGGVVCPDLSSVTLIGTSGGTTGDPTLFAERYTDPGCYIFTPRELWELGVRPGDYMAYVDAVMRSVGRTAFQDLGAITLLIDHDPRDLRRFVEWSLKYRPKTMFLMSSVLIYGLTQYQRETGVDMRDVFSSYTSVMYGGEPLGKKSQALMDQWNVPLYQMTSLGDAGTSWECRSRDGFHAWEDLVLLEVIDPETGEPTPDGERGEMVVTSLCDRTDPLIRFRSGDLVRWTKARCSCGRTHARFWTLGRASDEARVLGRSILPVDVWDAVESVAETSAGLFQIIRPQRDMDELKLRVGYDGTPDLTMVAGKVADAVEASVGVRPKVELMPDSELVKLGPYHKIPRTAKQ